LSVQKLAEGGYKTRWRELGHARSKNFAHKRDAETYDAEIKRRLRLGEAGIVNYARTTLTELHDLWVESHVNGLAPATRKSYETMWRAHIEPELGRARLGELRPVRIRSFSNALARRTGDASRERALIVLSAMLTFAEGEEMLSKNPMRGMKRSRSDGRKHEVVALSPSQVEELRSELRQLRDRTIVSVLAYAGLRPGEALHLRWRDLKEDGRLHIRGSVSDGVEKCTMTRKERYVRPLSPVVADLKEWSMASGRPSDSELIFPNGHGAPWSGSKYEHWKSRMFDPAATRIGFPGLHVYDLRHACASLLIAAGRNPAFIAKQLGHSIGTLLSTYVHIIDEYEERPPIDPVAEILEARSKVVARAV
jgi:integrase